MKKTIYLILSILCFLYFAIVVYCSYKHIVLNTFLGGLFELLTIPLIVLIILLLGLSTREWYLSKFSLKSSFLLPILILISTITLLIIATIYNIQASSPVLYIYSCEYHARTHLINFTKLALSATMARILYFHPKTTNYSSITLILQYVYLKSVFESNIFYEKHILLFALYLYIFFQSE